MAECGFLDGRGMFCHCANGDIVCGAYRRDAYKISKGAALNGNRNT